jgi:hypothetical protein
MIRFVIDVDTISQQVTQVQAEPKSSPLRVHEQDMESLMTSMQKKDAMQYAISITKSVSSTIGKHIFDMIEEERTKMKERNEQRKRYEPLSRPLHIRYFEHVHSTEHTDTTAMFVQDVIDVLADMRRLVIVFSADHAGVKHMIQQIDIRPMASIIIADPSAGLRITCMPAKSALWTPVSLQCDEQLD